MPPWTTCGRRLPRGGLVAFATVANSDLMNSRQPALVCGGERGYAVRRAWRPACSERTWVLIAGFAHRASRVRKPNQNLHLFSPRDLSPQPSALQPKWPQQGLAAEALGGLDDALGEVIVGDEEVFDLGVVPPVQSRDVVEVIGGHGARGEDFGRNLRPGLRARPRGPARSLRDRAGCGGSGEPGARRVSPSSMGSGSSGSWAGGGGTAEEVVLS